MRSQPAVSRRLFRCLWAHLLRSPSNVNSGSTHLARFFAIDGQSPPVENLGSPAPVLISCRLTSSRCRLRFVHRSFTFRLRWQLFREIKNPAYFAVSRVGKLYGSSITCLPPGYPNSFRGLALCTTWIGQG